MGHLHYCCAYYCQNYLKSHMNSKVWDWNKRRRMKRRPKIRSLYKKNYHVKQSRIKWKRKINNGPNCKKQLQVHLPTCSKVNCVQMEGESDQPGWTNTCIIVRRLMYEHLMVERRPNPKGGFYCWWCPKRSSSPSISAFDTPKMTKRKTSMRKLWPPKVWG